MRTQYINIFIATFSVNRKYALIWPKNIFLIKKTFFSLHLASLFPPFFLFLDLISYIFSKRSYFFLDWFITQKYLEQNIVFFFLDGINLKKEQQKKVHQWKHSVGNSLTNYISRFYFQSILRQQSDLLIKLKRSDFYFKKCI